MMTRRLSLLGALLAAGSLALAGERVGDPAAEKPLVIVYPLVSRFDGGKLGLRLRECFRGHALRSGSITCFDRISEEELLEASPLKAEPGSELAKIADHARATFKARYAIWGEVTRAGKGYQLRLLGAIVEPEKKTGKPGARLAADEKYDAENVHLFPQHAETFLAKLLSKDRRNLERKFGEVVRVLEEIPVNGDFSGANEKGDWPAGWTLVRPDLRPQVSWVQRPGGKADDKCILYNMSRKTAASEGIMLASAYFPLEKDAYYQASVEIMSARPKMIFWVRGYTRIDGERRETYRHQVRFYPEKKGEFERLTTRPFKPRNPLVKIEEIRVMLYAYHPAGKIWFDNAWLKRVEAAGDEQPDPAFVKEGGGEKLK